MVSYPESFDHMLAAWNERDPEKVRGHLEKALAANVEFIDPTHPPTSPGELPPSHSYIAYAADE